MAKAMRIQTNIEHPNMPSNSTPYTCLTSIKSGGPYSAFAYSALHPRRVLVRVCMIAKLANYARQEKVDMMFHIHLPCYYD